MINKVLYCILFLGINLLYSSNIISQNNKRGAYFGILDEGSTLIRHGYNYTLEKLDKKVFVYKIFNSENSQITDLTTFTSKKLKKKHGPFEFRYDDGTLVSKGNYRNNEKNGLWKENKYQMGHYVNGQKAGIWTTYGRKGIKVSEQHYANDEAIGRMIKYDSLGNVLADTAIIKNEIVQRMPRFAGCEGLSISENEKEECAKRKLLEYVYNNIKYPESARQNNVQGMALVSFVIDKEGNVIDVKVLRGLCRTIKYECQRLIHNMPLWRPGTVDQNPVKVQYNLPIRFRLQ